MDSYSHTKNKPHIPSDIITNQESNEDIFEDINIALRNPKFKKSKLVKSAALQYSSGFCNI